MFGAGGGTSSYEETRAADLIVLWGSNAREAHPIFFHHVLKAVNRGAKLIVVDPRVTKTAARADIHLAVLGSQPVIERASDCTGAGERLDAGDQWALGCKRSVHRGIGG